MQCWAVPGAVPGGLEVYHVGRFWVGFCHQRGQRSFGLGGDHVSVSMLGWLMTPVSV